MNANGMAGTRFLVLLLLKKATRATTVSRQ